MIDTHAHLDMLKSEEDLKDSIQKLDYIITIGCDKEEIYKAVDIAERFDNVYASVGYHPYDVKDLSDEDIKLLEDLYKKSSKIAAIGETGLDYYRDITPKNIQWDFFEKQLELAKKLKLPVIIHSRSANSDTVQILKNHIPFPDSGVLHCFGGDIPMMEECVEMGFYISFAGNITYPKADNLREVLKKTPLDRLLLETDSPFLSPQKVRGKPNKPSNIFYTLDFVSKFLGIEKEEIEKITDRNAAKLFKIEKTVNV
ncbi:TatD DNase family protein [Persephonella hydrogeniphila]|uniref:TatD DNase family protein n=1 Tax=Persephonella hydrogeniphila TaxID=198703 RepID=A0A285NIV0_9AQUI|nr:TatD family hydrolase [Persephonella hydrogeniphila]SNZ07786.1 TatD DNase family protein [Persephonella hydrogeniphila]